MSAHTPGPWHFFDGGREDEGSILSIFGEKVCDFGDNETYYNTAGTRPNDADIALICAAPHLLAACQLMVDGNHSYENAILAAHTAIAKATGK